MDSSPTRPGARKVALCHPRPSDRGPARPRTRWAVSLTRSCPSFRPSARHLPTACGRGRSSRPPSGSHAGAPGGPRLPDRSLVLFLEDAASQPPGGVCRSIRASMPSFRARAIAHRDGRSGNRAGRRTRCGRPGWGIAAPGELPLHMVRLPDAGKGVQFYGGPGGRVDHQAAQAERFGPVIGPKAVWGQPTSINSIGSKKARSVVCSRVASLQRCGLAKRRSNLD